MIEVRCENNTYYTLSVQTLKISSGAKYFGMDGHTNNATSFNAYVSARADAINISYAEVNDIDKTSTSKLYVYALELA